MHAFLSNLAHTGAYPEIWIRGGGVKGCGLVPLPPFPSPPSPSPPFPVPSLPLPLPIQSFPLPLEVGPINPAGGLGERCKLSQRGLGGAPAEIEFGTF